MCVFVILQLGSILSPCEAMGRAAWQRCKLKVAWFWKITSNNSVTQPWSCLKSRENSAWRRMVILNLCSAGRNCRIIEESPCTHIVQSLVSCQDSATPATAADMGQSGHSKAPMSACRSSPLFAHGKILRIYFQLILKTPSMPNFKDLVVF